MDRLTALRALVLVAEHQSFAEAARRMRMRVSPTAASRAVSDLEQSLGVTLAQAGLVPAALADEVEGPAGRGRGRHLGLPLAR